MLEIKFKQLLISELLNYDFYYLCHNFRFRSYSKSFRPNLKKQSSKI